METVTEQTKGRRELPEAKLRTREIERSIIKRFRKEIWRPFVR